MNSELHLTKEYCVYPGGYNLLPETAILLNQLSNSNTMEATAEPLSMKDFEGCYSLELLVGGVRREEIFIDAQNNILCIRVLQKNSSEGIDQIVFQRHLPLPVDADPEFIIAEYRMDILTIYIPKTSIISCQAAGHIVVY
jgi:HSP20 family molecular chaperone IbpA